MKNNGIIWAQPFARNAHKYGLLWILVEYGHQRLVDLVEEQYGLMSSLSQKSFDSLKLSKHADDLRAKIMLNVWLSAECMGHVKLRKAIEARFFITPAARESFFSHFHLRILCASAAHGDSYFQSWLENGRLLTQRELFPKVEVIDSLVSANNKNGVTLFHCLPDDKDMISLFFNKKLMPYLNNAATDVNWDIMVHYFVGFDTHGSKKPNSKRFKVYSFYKNSHYHDILAYHMHYNNMSFIRELFDRALSDEESDALQHLMKYSQSRLVFVKLFCDDTSIQQFKSHLDVLKNWAQANASAKRIVRNHYKDLYAALLESQTTAYVELLEDSLKGRSKKNVSLNLPYATLQKISLPCYKYLC